MLEKALQLYPSPVPHPYTRTSTSGKPPSQSTPVKSRDGNMFWRVWIQLMQGCPLPLRGWAHAFSFTGSCWPRCGQSVAQPEPPTQKYYTNCALVGGPTLHAACQPVPRGHFFMIVSTRDYLGHKQSSVILICHASCPSPGLAVLLQLHF